VRDDEVAAVLRSFGTCPSADAGSVSLDRTEPTVAIASPLIVVLAYEAAGALDPTTTATIVVLLREAALNGASVVVGHYDALLASF